MIADDILWELAYAPCHWPSGTAVSAGGGGTACNLVPVRAVENFRFFDLKVYPFPPILKGQLPKSKWREAEGVIKPTGRMYHPGPILSLES